MRWIYRRPAASSTAATNDWELKPNLPEQATISRPPSSLEERHNQDACITTTTIHGTDSTETPHHNNIGNLLRKKKRPKSPTVQRHRTTATKTNHTEKGSRPKSPSGRGPASKRRQQTTPKNWIYRAKRGRGMRRKSTSRSQSARRTVSPD